jgi:hypothetical protein
MTDMTIIRAATPRPIPRKENQAVTEMNPSCRRALKYRKATHLSKAENTLILHFSEDDHITT